MKFKERKEKRFWKKENNKQTVGKIGYKQKT